VSINELKSFLGACVADMRAIADTLSEERSVLTDDEQSRWGQLEEWVGAAKAQIERLEKIEAVAADARSHHSSSPTIIQRVDTEVADVRYLKPGEARDKALAVLEGAGKHLEAGAGDKVDRLLRSRDANVDGAHIARRLLVTENDDYRSAFVKLTTQAQPALTSDEARAVSAWNEFRAMSSTDANGGFGVPVLIDPSIILTAQGSLNPFRAISRVETITTDEWKGVSSAGVSWSYDAEGSEVSDDAPTLAQPSVPVYTARGFIPYSIEIGQDYPGFAAEMARLLAEGYDELQAQAFATGSGSGQPTGIITALDANTNVEVKLTTAGTFDGAQINKVWAALPDRYKANATFVMSHNVGNAIATFGNGNNLSFVTVDLTGVVSTIRTRPAAFSSYFPDVPTSTTAAGNVLAVGDFRNYVIAERAGMEVELVPHLFGTTNGRPTGQRGWFAYARHGADSVNDLGFRLLVNT
jgi:HK97 family phage major capsid protein